MLILLLLFIPVLFVPLIWLMNDGNAKKIALLGALVEMCVGFYAFYMFSLHPDCACFKVDYPWIFSLNARFQFAIDGISAVMVLLTTLMVPFIIQSTLTESIKRTKAFLSLILLMQFALVGVFLAKDALLFYFFWELALLPVFLLSLIWGGSDRKQITFKFFVYTLFGSLFMLLAIIYIWLRTSGGTEGVTQSFNILAFYDAAQRLSTNEQLFVFLAFYLAFAIKIPIFPFHSWQADTYVNAPNQGTMLLSGLMSKMGTFALIIWLIPCAPLGWQFAQKYVIIISVVSLLYGAFLAIAQPHFKRLLAYSSLSHVGLIAAGIFTMNLQGLQGGLYQMFSHGIYVIGLFFIVDILFKKVKTDSLFELGGIRNVSKVFAVYFLIILLGSVAMPFTNGFVGEFLLLNGLFQYNYILVALAGLTVILGAVYMLRAYQRMMHGKTNDLTALFGDIELNDKILLACFSGLIIFFGLFPDIIFSVSDEPLKALAEHVQQVILMHK